MYLFATSHSKVLARGHQVFTRGSLSTFNTRYKIRVFKRLKAIYQTAQQKQLKGPPTHEWINKTWSIHTVAYHSVLKMKEILKDYNMVTLEDGELSERSQTQNGKYC